MNKKFGLLMIVGVMLMSCASAPVVTDLPKPDASSAVVYFLSDEEDMELWEDLTPLTLLQEDQYIAAKFNAGIHNFILAQFPGSYYQMNLLAGKTYYVYLNQTFVFLTLEARPSSDTDIARLLNKGKSVDPDTKWISKQKQGDIDDVQDIINRNSDGSARTMKVDLGE